MPQEGPATLPALCLTSMGHQAWGIRHGASGMGHQAWGAPYLARPTWHLLSRRQPTYHLLRAHHLVDSRDADLSVIAGAAR